jgi:hypothetical protein
MDNVAAVPPARPKWWRWQPTTAVEIVFYLALMAVISGLISIALNGLLGAGHPRDNFISGAVIGVVINGVTLWVKRHHHHPATPH